MFRQGGAEVAADKPGKKKRQDEEGIDSTGWAMQRVVERGFKAMEMAAEREDALTLGLKPGMCFFFFFLDDRGGRSLARRFVRM